MIIIIDYGMGNLKSIYRKIERENKDVKISATPNDIILADKIILPGVGHFGSAINNIKSNNFWDAINEHVLVKNKPVLGICLGMQLMAKSSEEGNVSGFGWFDAEVVKFEMANKFAFKVPHTGWNSAIKQKKSSLLEGITDEESFYFVHSYHVKCNDSRDVLTTTNYSYEFVSAIERNNIFGVQFHPEKSHSQGQQLFKNFINL
ncbi:glutamine amidotransferase [Flavobacterium arsenatis]|uniref:Imidazole glycerol phosphate synthase subunit HisH n=1 Tax=Flavobacterium arsenatis TaxID=1484332 RepID=A0ABU1TPG6_9FLAO|nr:imidazole glycerol phosphate synthase subunit HisH [Flavobacterium arsenatis]MDR6967860.1 glutamine amidotransferase [Flavobacterium arsenatis]